MAPAKFSKIMFENEISAYNLLRDVQGKSVPMFYGHYHIVFPDREFYHDRVVYVVLLEYVEGTPMSRIAIHKMNDETAENLWKKVRHAIQSIHGSGVVRRLPHMAKMIWRRESERKVDNEIIWIDFSYSKIIREMDEEERQRMANSEYVQVLRSMDNAWNAE